MARAFSSSTIALSAGNAPDSTAFTWAAIYQTTSFASLQYIFAISVSSDDNGIYLDTNGTPQITLDGGGFQPLSGALMGSTSTWYFLAVTKQPGTSAIRFLLYNYAADFWARDNSGLNSAGLSRTRTAVNIGSRRTVGLPFNGDIEAVAIYDYGMADSQVDLMPYSLGSMLARGPKSMWALDQQSTSQAVVDLTGGGANQTSITGTSVSGNSVPILGYGHPITVQKSHGFDGPSLLARYVIPYAGNNANTLTTPSFTPVNGEVVVVKMQTWDTATSMGSVTGGSQTWTSQVVEAPGGFNGWAGISTTTITGSPGSMTVSATPSGACGHGMVVERWGNAQLAATPAVGSGTGNTTAPSVSVTTTAANSIVSWLVFDEQSINPATRAYRSSATDEYLDDQHTGPFGVTYYAYQQAATAGSQTFGLSAPSTLKWVAAGIEIQAPSTGGTGYTLTAQPGGATSAGTPGTFTQGSVLAARPGGATSAGTPAALTTGTALAAQPGGSNPGASGCTFTQGTTVTTQPGTALAQGGQVSLAVGSVFTVQTGGALPGSSNVSIGANTTLTAIPGGNLPGCTTATLAFATALSAGPGGTVTAGTTATLATGTGLTARPGSALPGAAGVTLIAGTALTAVAGAALPGSAKVGLLTGQAWAVAPAGTTPGATAATITVGSATATIVQPGTSLPAGTGVTLRTATALTAQTGSALPSGSACTFTAGTPGTFTLTAAPGGSLPAGSTVQQATGTVLGTQPSGATAGGSGVALTMSITLTAATGVALTGGTRVTTTVATALTALPGVTLTGGSSAVMGAATALAALPGSPLPGGSRVVFTDGQVLTVLPGCTVAGSSRADITGSDAILIRPGILTPGSTRSDPTPGSLPYPRLTAGTLRGPTYGGG